jgi:transposase InsO family protein
MDETEAQSGRYRILDFWRKHGLAATLEAFRVSRRTLFNWQARLAEQGGNIGALFSQSKAPQRRRKRHWPAEVLAEIRRLRKSYPNLGKEKIHVLLLPFCARHQLECPAPRTIGRIIRDAQGKMRHAPARLTGARGLPKAPRTPLARKPKQFRAKFPGHCVALDTIERHRYGLRRYITTVIDTHSRFCFALASPSRNSRLASSVWQLTQTMFPAPISIALTDNGSEFAKHFSQLMENENITHWRTYPRTPKMNAHCERFNRTRQDEFVDFHDDLLFTDFLQAFNLQMFDWIQWYNEQRPHHALGLQSPLQYISAFNNDSECNMYWPNTMA